MKALFLGVVADDFTGASDAASALVEAGVRTVLFNGVPERMPEEAGDTEAIVIATKTRTIPAETAVKEMLTAFEWLRSNGAWKLYFKYCATFDSTEKGNIGPVADAVLKAYGFPCTVLCPALPVNGRTVKEGVLYVNGIPLSESHMRNHPLTPMRESEIIKLIGMQSGYPAINCSVTEMRDWMSQSRTGQQVPTQMSGQNRTLPHTEEHYYVIPDYYEDSHGDLIAETFWGLSFLTGGSGLVGALGRKYCREYHRNQPEGIPAPIGKTECGKALLLAGSCSKVTLEQIAAYKANGHPWYQILPKKLLNGEQSVEEILRWISETESGSLIYSSQSPEEMEESQQAGRKAVAEAIERTFSELACQAPGYGYTRIISAGGETSGAVTKALGYGSFYIGPAVAPGIPIMVPVENPKLCVVLKSGGFGQEDFFERAVQMTKDFKIQ